MTDTLLHSSFGSDPDYEMAWRAVERGLLKAEQVDVAMQEHRKTPSSRLLDYLSLTPEQIRSLSPGASSTRPRPLPPEVEEVAKLPEMKVGKYVVVGQLGEGGMGVVVKAYDTQLYRWAALKFMKGIAGERGREYFEREARVVAGLSHPNIASIYEVGEREGQPYIAMQYVVGENLDKADLTLRQKLMAIRDAAMAVEHAHRQGIIHRDLKPQNILVERVAGTGAARTPAATRDEPARVYVMDFGLAKQQAVETSLSASGMVVGTPEYMPPEQARGKTKEIDARSDVYSLGATLYRLIAGVPPFRGETALDVMGKVARDEPVRLSRFYSRLPRDVETIVLKCLEKERSRRYATAGELAQDLQRYLDGEPISARPASVLYRARKYVVRRRALVASEALAFLVLAYGLYALFWPTYGSLSILSTPEGADVTLESGGRRLTPGRTPIQDLPIRTGPYRVMWRKAGYEDAVDVVDIRPDARGKLDKVLAPESGTLEAETSVEGVSMTVEPLDRRDVPVRSYPLPATIPGLPTGRYRLKHEKENYFPRQAEIVVAKGGISRARATLIARELWSTQLSGILWGCPALADFNLDGVPDCAVVSENGKICALSGKDGSRLWEQATGILAASTPALGDLNGDGVPDCVMGSLGKEVFALSGTDGSRLWVQAIGDEVISTPALGDLDGDGVPDCVVGAGDGNVYALSGKDGSRLWVQSIGGQATSSPTLGDLNGDGVPDCVVGSFDKNIYALSGKDGSRLWEQATGGLARSTPALGDLNGDGVPDCVVGSLDGKVYAFSGKDGSPLWEHATGSAVWSSPALGDLNGDGVPDCVVGSLDGTVCAFSGKDGSTLWVQAIGGEVSSIPALGDLDGDGVPDCVMGLRDKKVCALSGKDGSRLWEHAIGNEVTSSPALGDLNGDGVPDCVVFAKDKVYALMGKDGPRLWEHAVGDEVTSSPALGDLDGDGVPDCVVGSRDNTVYALSGKDGSTLWKHATGSKVDSTPGRMDSTPALGDLNGDGVPDCVVGSRDGKVHALSGKDGSRLWVQAIGDETIASPALGDLDGDGVPDCVVGSFDNKVYALSGKDGSTLWKYATGGQVYSTPALWDLNGDGVPDCVVGSSDGKVYALSGKDGSRLWVQTIGGHAASSSPTLGDLNGDGVPDCVVGSSDGKVYALSGKDGSTLWKQAIGDDVIWSPALGDLDGDGVPDCVGGAFGKKVYALSGKDGSKLWEQAIGGDASFTPALGDLNGDGVPDCVVGSDDKKVYAFSGKDGSRLWEQAIGGWVRPSRELRDLNGDGVPDCVVGSRDKKVYAFSGKVGIALSSPAHLGNISIADTVSASLLRRPDGSLLPGLRRELITGKTLSAGSRLALDVLTARFLVNLGRRDEARVILSGLRSDGFDSYAIRAYLFLCGGAMNELAAALALDPERTCDLLFEHRELWESGAPCPCESLQGRARAAAHILNFDYDLAFAETRVLEQAGAPIDKIEKLRGFLPREAAPYIAGADTLLERQGNEFRVVDGHDAVPRVAPGPCLEDCRRVVALTGLAMARSSGKEFARAAFTAGTVLSWLGEKTQAIRVLEQALQRSDLPEESRKNIRALLDRIRSSKP